MPIARLERTRATLPGGYQFGEAATALARPVRFESHAEARRWWQRLAARVASRLPPAPGGVRTVGSPQWVICVPFDSMDAAAIEGAIRDLVAAIELKAPTAYVVLPLPVAVERAEVATSRYTSVRVMHAWDNARNAMRSYFHVAGLSS